MDQHTDTSKSSYGSHPCNCTFLTIVNQDLKSADYEDRCCALTAVCYIDHKELQEAVLPSVLSCTDFPK